MDRILLQYPCLPIYAFATQSVVYGHLQGERKIRTWLINGSSKYAGTTPQMNRDNTESYFGTSLMDCDEETSQWAQHTWLLILLRRKNIQTHHNIQIPRLYPVVWQDCRIWG